MKYAEVSDVEAGFRPLSDDEAVRCDAMLEEAAVIIDAYNKEAAAEAKELVSCRMVRRQLGSGEGDAITFPTGATQGSVAALGYSQSWTMNSGSVGEMYLSKIEKRLLGIGNKIGCYSPLEGVAAE